MPAKPILVRLKPVALFAVLLLLTGCLSEGGFETEGPLGGGGSRGVSLSQAMQSSASGSRESLHGSGSSESYPSYDSGAQVGVAGSSGAGLQLADEGRDNFLQVPADVSYAVPFNGEFASIRRITLTPLCLENDRYCAGLFVAGDIMDLKSGTLPASAIKNTWMLESGVSGRLYLNPAHAFFSPYFSANIAYQILFWDYRSPVIVDGKEIQSDSLQAMGGYAGFGVAVSRNNHLSIFGEAGFGGTVFTDQTSQGFSNDVFHNFGYFSVKAGLCLKF